MRLNFRSSTWLSVRTRSVLPSPGTPSRSACPPTNRQVKTPWTMSVLPTMTLPISLNTASYSLRKSWARWLNSRVSAMRGGSYEQKTGKTNHENTKVRKHEKHRSGQISPNVLFRAFVLSCFRDWFYSFSALTRLLVALFEGAALGFQEARRVIFRFLGLRGGLRRRELGLGGVLRGHRGRAGVGGDRRRAGRCLEALLSLFLLDRLADLGLAALEPFQECVGLRDRRLPAAETFPQRHALVPQHGWLEGDAARGDVEEQRQRGQGDQPVPQGLQAQMRLQQRAEDIAVVGGPGQRRSILGVLLAAGDLTEFLQEHRVAFHLTELRRVRNRHAGADAVGHLLAVLLPLGQHVDEVRADLVGAELRL